MARAVERLLGRRISGGWINVTDGHTTHLRRIHQRNPAIPFPTSAASKAPRRIAEIAREAGPRDLLICVISGGASALMPAPVASDDAGRKAELTRKLLASGATIHEINTVRKHLS